MGNIVFGIPSASLFYLFGDKPMRMMSATYRAGFAFLEVFLMGSVWNNLRYYNTLARNLSLELRFHDGWTYTEGHPLWINYVANMMGYLPKDPSEARIIDIIKKISKPCVVYAEHARANGLPENILLQTYSLLEDGQFKISLRDFIGLVKTKQYRIVFDTQHVLEMFLNKPGVGNFKDFSRLRLGHSLLTAWYELQPYVAEIHLCDCRPDNSQYGGSNVWPGTGILPLKVFCDAVVKSEWSGPVSIEVAPFVLWRPNMVRRLKRLREIAERLFDA